MIQLNLNHINFGSRRIHCHLYIKSKALTVTDALFGFYKEGEVIFEALEFSALLSESISLSLKFADRTNLARDRLKPNTKQINQSKTWLIMKSTARMSTTTTTTTIITNMVPLHSLVQLMITATLNLRYFYSSTPVQVFEFLNLIIY